MQIEGKAKQRNSIYGRSLAHNLRPLLFKVFCTHGEWEIINKDKAFSQKHQRSKSCLNMIYLRRVRGFDRMFDHK